MTGNRHGRFRKILVGYDGSATAEKALEVALQMGTMMDAQVEVLSVVQPSEPPAQDELQAVIEGARARYETALQRIAKNARDNGIRITTGVVIGDPAARIIHNAEHGGADLIVVGRRGLTAFEKLVMGSVSERVLRHAPCPVLVTT